MSIDKHIKNLEKYCEVDNLFEKDGAFKEFCDNHIADIKAVIEELKNTQSDLYEANNRIVDLMNIIDERDKIIDLMAIDLKTPVNSKEWIIEYYKKRCENAKD